MDLVLFHEAKKALDAGLRIATRRQVQNGEFIFKQIPQTIPAHIIPNMTSLPASVKKEFDRRGNEPIHYECQLAKVTSDNKIQGYCPSVADLENKWYVLDKISTSELHLDKK